MFCFIFSIILKFDFVVKVYGNNTVNFDDYLVEDKINEDEYDLEKYGMEDNQQNITKEEPHKMDKVIRTNTTEKSNQEANNMDKNKEGKGEENKQQNNTKEVTNEVDDVIETNATMSNETSKVEASSEHNTTTPDVSDSDVVVQASSDDTEFHPCKIISSLSLRHIFIIILDDKLFDKAVKYQMNFMYGSYQPSKYQYVANLVWAYFRTKIQNMIAMVTLHTPKNKYKDMNVTTLAPEDYFADSKEVEQENESSNATKPEKPDDQNNNTETTDNEKNSPGNETVAATELTTTVKLETQEDSPNITDLTTTSDPKDQTTTTKSPDQKEEEKKGIRQGIDNLVTAYSKMDKVTGYGGFVTTMKDHLTLGIPTPNLPSTVSIFEEVKIKTMNLGNRRRIWNADDRILTKSYRNNNNNGSFKNGDRRKYKKTVRETTIFNRFNHKKRNEDIIKELIENFKASEAIKKYETKIVRTTAKSWSNFYKVQENTNGFRRRANFHERQHRINKNSYKTKRKSLKIDFDSEKDNKAYLDIGMSKYKLKTKHNAKIKSIKESRENKGLDIETDRVYGLTSESESVPKRYGNKMEKQKLRSHLKHRHPKLYKRFKKRHDRNKRKGINAKNNILRKNKGQKRFNVVKKRHREPFFEDRTRAIDNKRRPNTNKRDSNDKNRRLSNNRRPYGSKRRPPSAKRQRPSAKIRPTSAKRRPHKDFLRSANAKQHPSMYLTPLYQYNPRRFNENLNLTRRSNTKPISTELSYSYKEHDIKFHIQDAVRHPVDLKSKINKVQNVRRQMAPVDRISLKDESNYSDDEEMIKSNIYKVFNRNI